VVTILAVLTGVFILLSTTARTSNAVDGWNCGINYVSNIMFAVLHALVMELLPTKARGTGGAIIGLAFHGSTAIVRVQVISFNVTSF